MKRKRQWLTLLTVVGLLIAAFDLNAFAASPPAPKPPLTSLQTLPPAQPAARYADLLEKAQQNGTVRVIVGLSIDPGFVPEGDLDDPRAVQNQRQAIQTAQQAVLNELPQTSEVNARFQYIPYLGLTVDKSTLDSLIASPHVSSIEEDVPIPATLASSVPLIGADDVWAGGDEGSGWSVAVLDTGVQWDHEFFGGISASRVVTEACYSTTNAGDNAETLCPDGSDEQTTGHAADPLTDKCWSGGDGTGSQLCTHGTHVAGIAAGNHTGTGVSYDGVARSANVIAIQVFSRFNSDTQCGPGRAPCVMSYTSDQTLGLERVYALRNDYDIASVNMSLGGGKHTSACDGDSRKTAIDNLRSVGIATVVATGNDGYTDGISAPACISSAIAVGATTDADAVASFSNSDELVDLLAPGVDIDASVPDNTYGNKGGTSMATPHVAGAWALLKDVKPGASVDEILAALKENGVPVTDTRNNITKPRIQVDDTASALQPAGWLGFTTSWNTASNWTTGVVPTETVSVVITDTPAGGNFPLVDASVDVGNLTIEDGAHVSMSGAHTLGVYGSWVAEGTGYFDGSGGTVAFVGAGAQTISTTNAANDHFYHLDIGDGSTAQTVVLNTDIDVNGDLTVEDGASLDADTHTVSVAGDWLDQGQSFVPSTGTVVFDGATQRAERIAEPYVQVLYSTDFTDSTGWTYNDANGDGSYWGIYTGVPIEGGVRDPSAGYLYNSSNAADDWLFSPGIAMEAGRTYTITFAYGVGLASFPEKMSVHVGDDNTISAMTSGTQIFDDNNITNTSWATATQTFTPGASDTYYLGFYAYSDADMYFLSVDDVSVSTRIVPDPDLQFYDLTVNSTGSLTLDSAAEVGNDLTVNGVFDLVGQTVSVEGTLTNNGTLSQTLTAGDGVGTAFLHVQNAAGDTSKYHGVVITPTGSMGVTGVGIKGNSACTTGGTGDTVNRCFAINPGTDRTATVQFYYLDGELPGGMNASNMQVWHWGGSIPWDAAGTVQGIGTVGTDYHWVQVSGVTSYSPFVLTDAVAGPTAIRITGLAGRGAGAALLVLGLFAGVALFTRRRRT
jgi:subtilisin family serine protease